MKQQVKKWAKERLYVSIIQVVGILVVTNSLLGCYQQVRVDRWSDLERPCQPHGFYIAPKGNSLSEVAQVCKVEEKLLRKHNAWLITKQPFSENTVVWLKPNPNIPAGEETLLVDEIEIRPAGNLMSESLAPIGLPTRPAVTK